MMKKKIWIVAAVVVFSVAFSAWTFMPKKEKTVAPQANEPVVTHNDYTEVEGYPCPCTDYYCSDCGKKLEYSATAYKKYYKNSKCHSCNGKGCDSCDNTGRDWDWVPGCLCKKCKIGYEQPNDCYE